MEIQADLKKAIARALAENGIDAKDITLEHPAVIAHGDFSTNAALVYAKAVKISPRDLAGKLKAFLEVKPLKEVIRIDIAGPGFINFFLSPEFFVKSLASADENFGTNKSLRGEKILIEHTQPNPFKEFHIGHLMNNTIGEALSRIFVANGAEVRRATFHGDAGMHVAKALWAVLKQGTDFTDTKALGRAYALGAAAYEEDEAAKKEIVDINKKIYEKSDEHLNVLYEKGRKISFDDFERLYKRLGSGFEYHFYESETAVIGKKTVEAHIADGIFEKSDKAVVFKGERYGLHTRVFINSEGLPTYEAKDVGLVEAKRQVFPFTRAVTVVGNEQAEYFRVVNKAIELIHPDLAGKIHALPHGMLRLPDGKMSSRTGSVITADALIERVESMVAEKIKGRGYEKKIEEEIVRDVSLGAIKYSILRQALGSDIIFDFDKSISFEGDSGPYLQYTHARIKSLLEKAKGAGLKSDTESTPLEVGLVEKMLARFPESVVRAGLEYSPSTIATYLTELAGAFNTYYAEHTIVDVKDRHSPYKIALAEAVARVLKSGLTLLGIAAPERM